MARYPGEMDERRIAPAALKETIRDLFGACDKPEQGASFSPDAQVLRPD